MKSTMMMLAVVTGTLASSCADPVADCMRTCDGCCSIEGTCNAGNTPSACGLGTASAGGTFCASCSSGQVCSAGTCATPTCSSVVGTIFAVTGSDATFPGGSTTCGSANSFIPSGMQLSFFSNAATLHASGSDLTCAYSQSNCAVSVNCVVDPNNGIGLTLQAAPDGRSMSGDGLITRPGNTCNVAFKAAGGR